MPEHNTLTGTELHEPKGADSATTGETIIADGTGGTLWVGNYPTASPATADEGAVFKSDGAEGGSWSVASGHVYGQMDITNNTTVQALVAAVDGTLNTNTDYVKTTGSLWATGIEHEFTHANGVLTVPRDGFYLLNFWTSMKQSATSVLSAFKFVINGTTFSTRKASRKSGTGGDTGSISAHSMIQLAAGDTLEIYVAASANTNMTMVDAAVTLSLVEAL